MAAQDHAVPVAHGSGRAGIVSANLRRALLASLGLALVVAAEAVPKSFIPPTSLVLIPYSVLIWAVIPAMVTLVAAVVAALLRDRELPMWSTAVVTGVATASWVSWGHGLLPAGFVYGVLFGLGGTGVGAVLGAHRPVPVRVLAAVAIAAATALLVRLAAVVMS